ncbi:MAG: TolC family protein [Elusimicrobia bacterium]|nr:TolC family protein [Elusimicrobiota bacterium]
MRKLLLTLTLLPALAAAEDLDFGRAVKLALDNNLNMKLARAEGEAARAEALARASRLLPQAFFSASQSRTFRENLSSIGFGAPGGGPNLIGPFDTFDARLSLVQSLLDLPSAGLARSGAEARRAADLKVRLASEQVSAAAALAYLEVLRSSAALNSAAAGLELAGGLRALAESKHDAGTATGLDVLRARTREAEEKLRVSRASTALDDARLRLKRLLGLPFGRDLRLTEKLADTPYEAPEAGAAVKEALSGRLEVQIAEASLSASSYALKAAKGARVPSLALSGSAALSGNKPDGDSRLVGDMGLSLRMPLYAGGRVAAGVDAALSARRRAEGLYEDASAMAEQETLSALSRLTAAAEEVDTASMTVTMASQELEMARNRFAAGAGDNIELVEAQTSLSRARDSLVDALSRGKEANIRLSLALGRMQNFKF